MSFASAVNSNKKKPSNNHFTGNLTGLNGGKSENRYNVVGFVIKRLKTVF